VGKKTKRAYKYRFYPTDEQRIILAQTFGCVRFVYNWGLATRKTAYFQHGRRLSYNDLAAQLPALKKEYPWLGEVSSVPSSNPCAIWTALLSISLMGVPVPDVQEKAERSIGYLCLQCLQVEWEGPHTGEDGGVFGYPLASTFAQREQAQFGHDFQGLC
jgi:putative transposase